ncbi:hypothetical protein FJU11_12395 [Pararhizobium mangrovi]|uniref:PilZ domain-containing protein n=2 Tax=Pararhizobium mangrovi TaxID=2590452 RepID=A0A506U0X7_9HYPH|nr:hypothetical protein FJU11_12395 [Pararhizobium mangrovi]
MPQSQKHPNYLTRLADERRQWPRRQTNFAVRIVFTSQGVKKMKAVRASVVNLSEGGAAIISNDLPAIPQHFYIALGKFEVLIPCASLGIRYDVMRLRFVKDQPTVLIDALSAVRFPMALLDPLAHSDYANLLRYAGDSCVKHTQTGSRTLYARTTDRADRLFDARASEI